MTHKINVVYIGGFLAPDNEDIYAFKKAPSHINLLQVFPSGASSIHDRVMQIFFELKGGQVDFGHMHSRFHNHSEKGPTFTGKIKDWSSSSPVHLVGHSFGGITARALHAYLSQGHRFEGHATNSAWVVSVTVIDSPLNGSLMVYSLGANEMQPPTVRWGSLGCIVGWLAHMFEYLDESRSRQLYDFKLGFWNLSHKNKGAFMKLFLAMLGVCIHTTTDNSAYDMTLQSQLAWAQELSTISSTYYLSIVGTDYRSASTSWSTRLVYDIRQLLLRAMPTHVAGVNTTAWMENGFDGLLSAATQIQPFIGLPEEDIATLVQLQDAPGASQVQVGVWYTKSFPLDHLGVTKDDAVWDLVFRTMQAFHIAAAAAAAAVKSRRSRSASRSPPLILSAANPDCQIPKWRYDMRPTICIGRRYAVSIILAGSLALYYIVTTGPPCSKDGLHSSPSSCKPGIAHDSSLCVRGCSETGTHQWTSLAIVGAASSVLVALCGVTGHLLHKSGLMGNRLFRIIPSDHVEVAFSLARLATTASLILFTLSTSRILLKVASAVLSSSLRVHTSSVYAALLVGESMAALVSSPRHDYCVPFAKAIIAASICTVPSPAHKDSVWLMLVAVDLCCCASKAGWLLCWVRERAAVLSSPPDEELEGESGITPSLERLRIASNRNNTINTVNTDDSRHRSRCRNSSSSSRRTRSGSRTRSRPRSGSRARSRSRSQPIPVDVPAGEASELHVQGRNISALWVAWTLVWGTFFLTLMLMLLVSLSWLGLRVGVGVLRRGERELCEGSEWAAGATENSEPVVPGPSALAPALSAIKMIMKRTVRTMGGCAMSWWVFNKLRDLSDSFQVFWILESYESEAYARD